MLTRVTEPVLFEQQADFAILPKMYVQKFKALDLTPSVKNILRCICNNTIASTITNFKFGSDGQTIMLLGDGFTSIAFNAQIKTNTGAVKLLVALKIYTFTYLNNIWYEAA